MSSLVCLPSYPRLLLYKVDTECRTNEALAASTAKCDAAQAALDDCRTALAERSHELRGVHQILAARDEVETAAREAALGEAIASAEGLARPSQETGDLQEKLLAEESRRRRVEADLEEANEALNATMVRCKEAEEAAAMAGEKAKAQWEADLAIAEEKRDTLMELQRRIAEVEVCCCNGYLYGVILQRLNSWTVKKGMLYPA